MRAPVLAGGKQAPVAPERAPDELHGAPGRGQPFGGHRGEGFPHRGRSAGQEPARRLQAHQAQLLLAAGNPETAAAPVWRKVS